jgi:RHS repeat-associated protein
MTALATDAIDEVPSRCVVTDTYEYDAFGNALVTTGSTPNNYLYRGEQFDPDLGLYYLRARYCNPTMGRFMSRDPEGGKLIDPRTLHKYLYAGGDPTNRMDPRGRAEILQFVFTTANISSPVTPYEYGFGLGVAAAYTCYADAVIELLNWEIRSRLDSPLDLPCLVLFVSAGP